MDRLVNLLSDALAVAVGDLVEARADLVSADGARAEAERKAVDLFDECQRLKKSNSATDGELLDVYRLVEKLKTARGFQPVTPEGHSDKARDLDAAGAALEKWLDDKNAREIPF